jgi:hypothetical protein
VQGTRLCLVRLFRAVVIVRTRGTQRVGYVAFVRASLAGRTCIISVCRYCEEAGIALTVLVHGRAQRRRLRVFVTLRTRSVCEHLFEKLVVAHLTRVSVVLEPRLAQTIQSTRRVHVVKRARALRAFCACFSVLGSEETGIACNAVQGLEVLGLRQYTERYYCQRQNLEQLHVRVCHI